MFSLMAICNAAALMQDLKKSGLATDESISEAQKMRQVQMESLKQAALDSRPPSRTER